MPLAPEALAAMKEAWAAPSNASSPHGLGQRAHALLDRSRKQVADLIGSASSELTFTSGATEANNLVLRGVADWARNETTHRRRLVVSAVEHKAVLETAKHLELRGFEVIIAPVDHCGLVDLSHLATLVDEATLLVSVMLVNNETGVVQPVQEIAQLCRDRGALLHSDGAQAVGKLPLDVFDLGVDYLSVSAHKLYGPMGVGALYVASDAPKPIPQIFGGGQERGLRAGTEPVPLIAGFGAAAEAAQAQLDEDGAHAAALKMVFLDALAAAGTAYRCVTNEAPVVNGGIALSFPEVSADDIVSRVADRLCISTGSACTSGQVLPSHVLQAMGLDHRQSRSVIRFYFSRFNSEPEVIEAATILGDAVRSCASPLDALASQRYDAAHEACADRQ